MGEWMGHGQVAVWSAFNRTLSVWEKIYTKMDGPNKKYSFCGDLVFMWYSLSVRPHPCWPFRILISIHNFPDNASLFQSKQLFIFLYYVLNINDLHNTFSWLWALCCIKWTLKTWLYIGICPQNEQWNHVPQKLTLTLLNPHTLLRGPFGPQTD